MIKKKKKAKIAGISTVKILQAFWGPTNTSIQYSFFKVFILSRVYLRICFSNYMLTLMLEYNCSLFQSLFSHLLSVWLWANYLNFPILILCVGKIQVVLPTSHSSCKFNEMTWVVLSTDLVRKQVFNNFCILWLFKNSASNSCSAKRVLFEYLTMC